MNKLIITAALTGSLTTRAHNPNLPHTPAEIARAAVEAWKAGASVVHLHVRDPETGAPVHDVRLFAETIRLIRAECDLIINVTTGAGPKVPIEERIAVIPELADDPATKPEMASLNCGSVNFGLLDRKKREFVLSDVQMNPWTAMLDYADTMKKHGVVPELEVYEAGMINNALVLQSLEALDPPLHFQFVLGVLGGMQATTDNLVFLKNALPPDATWSVCAVGLPIYSLAPVAIGLGGNVRVGFEDCIRISRTELAESNAQMVAKIARMAADIGREVANPVEARQIAEPLSAPDGPAAAGPLGRRPTAGSGLTGRNVLSNLSRLRTSAASASGPACESSAMSVVKLNMTSAQATSMVSTSERMVPWRLPSSTVATILLVGRPVQRIHLPSEFRFLQRSEGLEYRARHGVQILALPRRKVASELSQTIEGIGRAGGLHPTHGPLRGHFDRGGEYRVAAAKMPVKSSGRDADRLGYARHRHAVDPVLAEDQEGGVDDLLAALRLALSGVLLHGVRHSLSSLPFITEYTINRDNSEPIFT